MGWFFKRMQNGAIRGVETAVGGVLVASVAAVAGYFGFRDDDAKPAPTPTVTQSPATPGTTVVTGPSPAPPATLSSHADQQAQAGTDALKTADASAIVPTLPLVGEPDAPIEASITQPVFRNERSFGFILTMRAKRPGLRIKTFGRGDSAYGWTASVLSAGHGCFGSEDRLSKQIPHVREDLGNPDRREAMPLSTAVDFSDGYSFFCSKGTIKPGDVVKLQIQPYVVEQDGTKTPVALGLAQPVKILPGL